MKESNGFWHFKSWQKNLKNVSPDFMIHSYNFFLSALCITNFIEEKFDLIRCQFNSFLFDTELFHFFKH